MEQRPQQWQNSNVSPQNTQYPQNQQWNRPPYYQQYPQSQQYQPPQYYPPPMAQPYNPNMQPPYVPYPQRPLSPQPPLVKKINYFARILSIIGSVLFIVGATFTLISMASNNSQVNSSNTQTSITQPKVQPAKVGDTITLDGINCTLVSVNYDALPLFMAVDVKIVNNSQSEYTYYASDLQLETNSGSILNPTQVGEGTLAPGGQAEVTLEFDNVDTYGVKLLLWQPQGYSQDLSHFWNLNPPKQSGSGQ